MLSEMMKVGRHSTIRTFLVSFPSRHAFPTLGTRYLGRLGQPVAAARRASQTKGLSNINSSSRQRHVLCLRNLVYVLEKSQ